MADEFDIEDLIYDAIEKADVGMIIYKDNSVTGEKENHIVINCLQLHNLTSVNKAPVYVNILIKNHGNGMPDRPLMKETKRKVGNALKGIRPRGMYFDIEIEFSERLKGAKEGFDCRTFNVLIRTEK